MYAALPNKCLLEKIANKSWHTHAFGKHNIYGKLQKLIQRSHLLVTLQTFDLSESTLAKKHNISIWS